jgi:hypothetical protein
MEGEGDASLSRGQQHTSYLESGASRSFGAVRFSGKRRRMNELHALNCPEDVKSHGTYHDIKSLHLARFLTLAPLRAMAQ